MKRSSLMAASLMAVIALTGCQPASQTNGNGSQTASTGNGAVYSPDMENCAGFTANDASAISGVPAAELETKVEMVYEGFWQCSYLNGDYNGVSFGVAIAQSEQEAINDMESYRENLEVAAGLPQFQDEENGAYSDIIGNGYEGIWTTINGTLNARRGNISIQISRPEEKLDQIKVADTFFSKL